jgi:tetratricopeptide (TPR) repeat protein
MAKKLPKIVLSTTKENFPENWYETAALHHAAHDYPIALKLLEKYLNKKIEELGSGHNKVATIHEEMGDLYTAVHDSEKALHHTSLCLKIQRMTRSHSDTEVVNTRMKVRMIRSHRYNGISEILQTIEGEPRYRH